MRDPSGPTAKSFCLSVCLSQNLRCAVLDRVFETSILKVVILPDDRIWGPESKYVKNIVYQFEGLAHEGFFATLVFNCDLHCFWELAHEIFRVTR